MAHESHHLLRGNKVARYASTGKYRDAEPFGNGDKHQALKLGTALVLAIGVFLTAADQLIVVSAFADISSELQELQRMSWIATAYMLTLTGFQPSYGKLSDIFGRKSCLMFGYTIFGVGCLLCSLARTMNELILARAVAGIGGGGLATIASIIVSDLVPLRSRGTWQGFFNIAFAAGMATGAPLGGLLTDTLGWRWSFKLQVPVVALAMFTVAMTLPTVNSDRSNLSAKIGRVDFAGMVVLLLMIFALLFGLERGVATSWHDGLTIASLGMCVLFLVLFGVIETMLANEPIIPAHIILNPSLAANYVGSFFGPGAAFAASYMLSLYLQAVLQQTAFKVGLWQLPGTCAQVIASLAGVIIQATGKYYTLSLCSFVLNCAGITAIALIMGSQSSLGVELVLAQLTTGIGHVGATTASVVALVSSADPDDQAIATAVFYLSRQLGSLVILSVGSAIMQETLRSVLRTRLKVQDVEQIIRRVRESLHDIDLLDPATATIVRSAYDQAIHLTWYFTAVLAACAVGSALFIKERPLVARPKT